MVYLMTAAEIDGVGMTSARTRARLSDQLKQLGITSKVVLDIMGAIPRHLFVDEALAHRAYDNVALPIGQGQTISSPYIVAKMTELVSQADKLDKVLEIGTGCGYQTAVLAHCFKTVYTIERISTLLLQTRARLNQLNIHNVRIRHGDGMLGWPEMQPFDAIIVTAAASQLPETLVNQLAVGGKMIFPFGKHTQELKMIGRTTTGFVEMRLEKVKFVPLLPGTI
jgi:protein-L-isoaspartate(D-aspartate) O-methyltransferase